MNKHQRLLELARLIFQNLDTDLDGQLAAFDCFMTLPDCSIPDRRSLRYFAYDIINYFLDINGHCKTNYPEAARYIRKWKKVWLPKPPSPPHFNEHEWN